MECVPNFRLWRFPTTPPTMPSLHTLAPVALTAADRVTTDVEFRRSFSLAHCELNIYETRRNVRDVHLEFSGYTITSMLRGRKQLHVDDTGKLMDYVPGHTVLVPAYGTMDIDFPEATPWSPTQCTALVVDQAFIQSQLDELNERAPKEHAQHWALSGNDAFLQNDARIAGLSNRIVRVLSGSDPLKDILAELLVKELVLALIQAQNRSELLLPDGPTDPWNARFQAVVEYIRRNLSEPISVTRLCELACMSRSAFYRAFTSRFGIAPNQMILQERINHAKELLDDPRTNVKEVCYATGFTDPNYFIRMFKKQEGTTPGRYRADRIAAA